MKNTSRNTRPYAGKTEVILVAETLLLQNGQTTTLEVKNALREEGYIAFQADVSYFMKTAVQQTGWRFTCNGRNRTYYPAIRTDWKSKLLDVCLN